MIRRIAIKNCKSLDVDFRLAPVTVLVGRSGTGKTNLVEGLRFLRDLLADPGGVSNNAGHLVGKTAPVTADPEFDMRFEVEYDVPPLKEAFLYTLVLHCRKLLHPQLSVVDEYLRIGDQVAFHARGKQWETKPKVVDMPDLQGGPILASLAGIKQVSVAHIALTQGIGCYDFPGTVCTGPGRVDKATHGLDDQAGNYAQAFDDIQGNLTRLAAWDEINSALHCLNSSFKTLDVSSRQKGRLVVAHEFNGKVASFDIAQESEGFRRFLAYLLALYQTPSKQTLVFEEPEKGIHPGALQTLAEELKAAPEDGRGQVILTTHSPNLLDHFPPESIRAVEIHGHVTRIGPLVADQLAALKAELLRPGELLTVEDAKAVASSAET